ncbi:MAG: hypothetical protein RL348_1316 [Bacteroidota bacterium]|jgi:hypothetical protein
MTSIKVFVYGYKNKNLLENLQDIISKQSNQNGITYYVYDQNNVNRDFLFNKVDADIVYNHIKWDDMKSITHYRNMALLHYSNCKYYLEINPNISLMNEWDIYLTSNIDDKKIISGFGMPKLSINKHHVVVDRQYSDSIKETNYVDTDLIFCSQIDAMTLIKLKKLKEIGQDLFASLLFVNKGYRIYSLPTNLYHKEIQENSNTYKSFSINHGYNKMLSIIKKENNDKFESFHGISIGDILEIPYQVDDVYYSDYNISLENMNAPRFIAGYNKVQIT